MYHVAKYQLSVLFFTLLFLPFYVQSAPNLSVADLHVENDIFMNDSVDQSTGNVMKGATPVRFIHNHGTDNTFVGLRSGNFKMTGINNTGFGADALRANDIGQRNVAIGKSALRQNVVGARNVAIGYRAMRNSTGGTSNVAIGDNAMLLSNGGINNTAIGRNALRNCITCNTNTAIGKDCFLMLQTGQGNTAVGVVAGSKLTNGTFNNFIGTGAGRDLESGTNNLYVANAGVASENNTIRIGDTHTQCFIAGINNSDISFGTFPVQINLDGRLGIIRSSSRFKRNINAMNNKSEQIYDLTPVTFIYKNDDSESPQFGLIAEEVDRIFPELVAYDNDGMPYTVRYEVLPVLLLNEMKKQKQTIDTLLLAVKELQDKVQYFMAA